MLLSLLLAAAPVDLHVLGAGLVSPTTKVPIGAMSDVTIVPLAWTTPTTLKLSHDTAQVTLEAVIDLSREGTFVEAIAQRAVRLVGTGEWVVVLKRGATVPLVGRTPEGLRVGFQLEDTSVVAFATVPDDERGPPPPASGPAESCLVTTLHSRADQRSPKWKLPSFSTTVHRGPSKSGWAAAWVETSTTIVHGFVRDADVLCDVGSGGGLGLAGVGTSSGDGLIEAQAATVPVGAKFFASEAETEWVATLKAPARGLKLKNGSWRLEHLKSGSGELRLSNVFLGHATVVQLEPVKQHGVGGSSLHKPEWPKLKR